MEYDKITHGCVIQRFKNGKPVSQRFVAGDTVEYEVGEGWQSRTVDQEGHDQSPCQKYKPKGHSDQDQAAAGWCYRGDLARDA